MSEVAASIWSHLGLVITALCSKLHVSVGFCKPKPKMRRNLPTLHYLGDGTLVGWEAGLADPLALAEAQPADPLPLAGRQVPPTSPICSLIGVPKVTSVVSIQSYLPVPKGPPTTYRPGDFFASLLEAEEGFSYIGLLIKLKFIFRKFTSSRIVFRLSIQDRG